MTIRVLVNAALLAIPIAVTLGILFGLQSHRSATGQPPLFAPEPPPIPTPKPKAPANGITKTRYCQKSIGITPETKGQQYTRMCPPPCHHQPESLGYEGRLYDGEASRGPESFRRIIWVQGSSWRPAIRCFGAVALATVSEAKPDRSLYPRNPSIHHHNPQRPVVKRDHSRFGWPSHFAYTPTRRDISRLHQ